MNFLSYTIVSLALVLGSCSNTVPKSCVVDDDYPRPASLCNETHKPNITLTRSSTESPKPLSSSQKLTLADVLLRVIDSNPDVGIAGAREKEQSAAIEAAKAARLPSLDLSMSAGPQHIFWPSPGGDAVRKEASIGVKQVLFDFGATKNDISRAEMAYASASASRVAKTEDVAFQVLKTYLKVLQADDQIRITQENIAAHSSILNLVELREKNGNGTLADIKRITTRLENAKAVLIDLTTQRADAAAAFENLTLINADKVDPTILKSLKGQPEKIDRDIIEANPLLTSLKQELASLEYQLASAKAEKLPSIGLQGSVRASQNVSSSEDGDDQFAVYGLVTVRLPVFDGGLNNAKQNQIRSRIEATHYKLEKERRSLWEDSRNAMRVTTTDGARSGSLEARVAAAKKVADLNLEQFRSGSKSVFELLDGQADYFKAKSDVVGQVYSRMEAEIRALQLRGQLVRAILGLPVQSHLDFNKNQPTYQSVQYSSSLPGVKIIQ